MRIFQLGDLGITVPIECACRQDKNGCIYEECEVKCEGSVENIKTYSGTNAFGTAFELARLHEGRVQVKIVRHHSGAYDPYRDVERLLARNARNNTGSDGPKGLLCHDHLRNESEADRSDEGDDERLHFTYPEFHQEKKKEGVGNGDAHANDQIEPEEQLQPYGHSYHLGKIAGGNGYFGQQPK